MAIVDYLNDTDGSPWQSKIAMANQEAKGTTVNQKTFVKAIKRYVLTANNPISVRASDERKKIMLNYWKAVAALLDAGKPTVLFKSIGVELFSRFSTPLFHKLQNLNNFKVATIQSPLKQTFDNLDGESAAVGHPEWWLSGSGPAGGLNAAALGKINQELTKALHKTHAVGETQL